MGLDSRARADRRAPPHGYNLRRERLDPLLRRTAAETPGVVLLAGHAARGLVFDDGAVAGVRAALPDGTEVSVRGRLVVAADGRQSQVARWAGVPRESPNGRFFYYAQYRGLPTNGGRSRMWFHGRGVAYTFPNEDGITVAAASLPKEGLAPFKADPDAALRRHLSDLPEGPDFSGAERVGPAMGFVDMPNLRRPAAAGGIALVGDAALSVDPVWGTGCAWALKSAEWLVDAVAPSLLDGRPSAGALGAYARRHRRELGGHAWHISSWATGRPWWAHERLILAAAAIDPTCAQGLFAYSTRNAGLTDLMAPRALARAATSLLVARARSGMRRRSPEPSRA